MRLLVLAACVLLSSLLAPLLAYAGERIERRTWLWVEPMSGGSGVYGAAVRIEYR